MSSSSQEDTIFTITALRHQEDASYLCQDNYQAHSSQNQCFSGSAPATSQTRNVLCDWAMKIIDFCSLDRETVEIAMSYVDRFAQTERGSEYLKYSDKYQLLVVAALYVAIKIHENVAISTTQFAKISRNSFTVEELEEMERLLLQSLDWHMNPPTSLSFVRLFLDLVPEHLMAQDLKDTAYILSRIQTELAVYDVKFVPIKASVIAFASIMNSFEALGMMETSSGSCAIHAFVTQTASLALVDKEIFQNGVLLSSMQTRLYHAIAKQNNLSIFVGAASVPSSPTPGTPTKRGIARNKSFEETPRSIVSRTA
jgi:hypothetical protein